MDGFTDPSPSKFTHWTPGPWLARHRDDNSMKASSNNNALRIFLASHWTSSLSARSNNRCELHNHEHKYVYPVSTFRKDSRLLLVPDTHKWYDTCVVWYLLYHWDVFLLPYCWPFFFMYECVTQCATKYLFNFAHCSDKVSVCSLLTLSR